MRLHFIIRTNPGADPGLRAFPRSRRSSPRRRTDVLRPAERRADRCRRARTTDWSLRAAMPTRFRAPTASASAPEAAVDRHRQDRNGRSDGVPLALNLYRDCRLGGRGAALPRLQHGEPAAAVGRAADAGEHGPAGDLRGRRSRSRPAGADAGLDPRLRDDLARAGTGDRSRHGQAAVRGRFRRRVGRHGRERRLQPPRRCGAGLSAREVSVLRAYAKYLRQVGIPFSQAYMERRAGALSADRAAHRRPVPARCTTRRRARTPRSAAAGLLVEIEHLLDAVTSLDEDRILRRFLNLRARRRCAPTTSSAPTAGPSRRSRSSSTAARSRSCRCRGRWSRSSSTARASRRSICAAARSRAAASAGPTAARISAPRSSA